MQMTPLQCKLARMALKWNRLDLALRAGCGEASVSNFELDYYPREVNGIAWKMQEAFERAGIVFKPHGIEYPPDWDELAQAS